MKSVHPLRHIAGGLILAALIYAPLALGSIPPPLLLVLEGLLALATLFWAADALLHRTRPRVPLLLCVCCGWLLLQGWGMAWNAHSAYTVLGTILPVLSPLNRLM